MGVFFILLAVGGIWLLEKQQATKAAAAKAAISSGVTVNANLAAADNFGSGVKAETSTDSEISTGFSLTAKATSSIPIVGQITGIAAQIAGIFTADHTAAVAKEATTLNTAIPTFTNAVEQTMAALNEGAISESEAISYLNQAQSNYYTTVSAIIKKGGSCDSQCVIGGGAPRTDGGTNTSPNCCNTSGTCNASCCIGCSIVEPTIAGLIKAIQSGGGTVVIASTQDNGAIQGTPRVVITYTPYVTPPTVSLGSTLSQDLKSLF